MPVLKKNTLTFLLNSAGSASGNSPQPKVTDPVGGEQPAVNAGSATFPLDVVAAWAADRHTLTVAMLNPTDADQANLAICDVTSR